MRKLVNMGVRCISAFTCGLPRRCVALNNHLDHVIACRSQHTSSHDVSKECGKSNHSKQPPKKEGNNENHEQIMK